jgi:hypothetical protein
LPPFVHPYTAYLKERTRDDEIDFSPGAKLEPGYGTAAYFADLDRDAPREPIQVPGPNRLAAVYPFGYYAVLAAWIGVVRHFSDSLTVTFFAARIFSVMLLGVTLTAAYGTLRLLNFTERFALLLTAGIGLFPLTSFISSYVQPDNLSWMLVTVCYYFALRFRAGNPLPLGLALGCLAVTKAQFFACVAPSVIALLAADLKYRCASWQMWLKTGTSVLLPSMLLGSAYLWSVRGTENYFGPPATSEGVLTHHLRYTRLAIRDFFTGMSHDSFWGLFGWMDTPIVIRGPRTTAVIQFVLRGFARITVALTLLGIALVSIRLIHVARRKHVAQAIRFAAGNPLINSLLIFAIIITALYVRTENRFAAQGRNWLPVILPIFLLGIVYAPRALSWRPAIRAYTAATLTGLLLYDAVGGYYALQTVHARYYVPFTSTPTESTLLSNEPADTYLAERSGDAWEFSSKDGYLDYRLDSEQFVHGFRLEFKGTSVQPGRALRVVWRDKADPVDSAPRCAGFRSPINGVPQGVTAWTNGVIREFRIYVDNNPCLFEISAITVLH